MSGLPRGPGSGEWLLGAAALCTRAGHSPTGKLVGGEALGSRVARGGREVIPYWGGAWPSHMPGHDLGYLSGHPLPYIQGRPPGCRGCLPPQ